MGWREFCGWLEVLRKHQEGAKASADSWDHADQDPGWIEMRAKRDRLLQR